MFCHQNTTLCSPVPEMNLGSVFSGGRVIGSTPLVWFFPVGILGFPVAVMVSPLVAVGMGAFGRSLTSAELNPMEE